MSSIDYETLQRARIVQDFERRFRQTTGMWVRLIPAEVTVEPSRGPREENPFCKLVTSVPQARAICQKTEAALQRLVWGRRSAQQCRCFAGLTVVATPVLARGEHVATLLAGQVLHEKPTARKIERLSKQLTAWGVNGQWPVATRAYLNTPVVAETKFQSVAGLLSVFAQLLGEYASSNLLACYPDEEPAIAKAKEYVDAHLEDRVRMPDVARRVGLSPDHFCRMFRQVTGMTFTECVARARIGKAKTLLANPFIRVSEVAYACGFQAIPHFNEVFKRYTRKSPTKYRKSLEPEYTI